MTPPIVPQRYGDEKSFDFHKFQADAEAALIAITAYRYTTRKLAAKKPFKKKPPSKRKHGAFYASALELLKDEKILSMLCTALKGFAGGLKDLLLVILGALVPEYLHGTIQKVSLHP